MAKKKKSAPAPLVVPTTSYASQNGHGGAKKAHKTRDSDCCSINFVKYVLHIFNIIFFMSGLVIVGVTVWTVLWKHHYVSLLSTTNYAIGTYSLLAAGLLAVLGGILGCCGVWREQRALLLGYTFILLFVFLLEATVGGLAYLYETQIELELQTSLNSTFMEQYGVSERQTEAIDRMQQEFGCCGAVRFEDWRYSVWLRSRRKDLIRPTEGRLVPDSCCISMTPRCGRSDRPSNIPYTGCIYKMADDLKHHLILLGAIGLGICVIQLFGMILSCCLYVKLKNVLD